VNELSQINQLKLRASATVIGLHLCVCVCVCALAKLPDAAAVFRYRRQRASDVGPFASTAACLDHIFPMPDQGNQELGEGKSCRAQGLTNRVDEVRR
jgi:hypothetical protein